MLAGLIAQVALLAALAGTVGLGVLGGLVGLAYGVAAVGLLSRALGRSGAPALGPADVVTLARSVLVGGVAALVADSFVGPVPLGALTALAVVALVLDAVDGRVARYTRTVSAVGARFDMEVDSVLVLLLSVYVARSLGIWVLAIGSVRYAYWVAGRALPWLRGPVPPRYWCKVVAAVQGIVLVTAAAGRAAPHRCRPGAPGGGCAARRVVRPGGVVAVAQPPRGAVRGIAGGRVGPCLTGGGRGHGGAACCRRS